MSFVDLHIHALFAVDDGAKTESEMYAMVDTSYADGVRVLCATPHFHPGYFGDNTRKVDAAYEKLTAYIRQRYPDLRLCLGNELRYSDNCISWLRNGICRTMNDTASVLVDFHEDEAAKTIHRGLNRLLNAGYSPILAHAERYGRLDLKSLYEFRDNGVGVQIDTQSIFYGFGWGAQRRCRSILKAHLADFVGSDAHDRTRRPPGISRCYEYIQKQWGKAYAEDLCWRNAHRRLADTSDQKGLD